MTSDANLQWLADNWKPLVQKYGEHNMDVLVDNIDRIIERWDGQRKFEWYLHVTVKWLIHKKEHPRFHADLILAAGVEDKSCDEVRELLEGLSEESGQLLFLKFVLGYTYERIAQVYGVSQGTAFNYVQAALREARAQSDT